MSSFQKITESSSHYQDLEQMSVTEILTSINQEDQKVALAVQKVLPMVEQAVVQIVACFRKGGRLFYIGAGTSGRLGVVDASECPPTFGVPHEWVVGLIAGGDAAIRKAVEFAEDNTMQAWKDLEKYNINSNDFVMGIAASGTTPYVIGGLQTCNENGIATGCITCNPGSPMGILAQFPIEVAVGPEFVTGSTRMKAGTAQKLILNMVSTSVMIQLGRVKGNKMVDMQLSNDKLVARAEKMLIDELNIAPDLAADLIQQHGNVRAAIQYFNSKKHE
ncbi:MAG: N-acetylmuramic acid 6-phosphate etherase [Flavobacterium sp.]